MKVVFDARLTRMDKHDGLSRYGASLLEALVKQHPVTVLIYDERQLKLLPKGLDYVVVNNPFIQPVKAMFSKAIPYDVANNLISPRELVLARWLNSIGAEVVFSPLQSLGLGHVGRRYRLILTLHDLTYYAHPTPPYHLSASMRLLWRCFYSVYWPHRLLLDRGDHIAAVSRTTKEMAEQMKLTKRPVSVVYNSPIQLTRQVALPKFKKELIYMGYFWPYKNVEFLVQAMSLLPDYQLHILSAILPERRVQLARLSKNPGQIKFWNGVTDEQYTDLLGTATALVMPSKGEGFGLPIVEAMSAGTPVACSDIPIFHEIGGEAPLFFDPDDQTSFASTIRRFEKQEVRTACIEKGLSQADTFSWDKSATDLLKLMKQLAEA